MSNTFTENWDSYAEDSLMSANPPNFAVWSQLGAAWDVKTSPEFSSKSAHIHTAAGEWGACIFRNQVFTALTYFEFEARISGEDARMVWGIEDLTLDGLTNKNCYSVAVTTNFGIILGKRWQGGISYLASLATASLPVGLDFLDFTCKVKQYPKASAPTHAIIEIWLNGALALTYEDATPYTSGYLGFQTVQQECYWDAVAAAADSPLSTAGAATSWASDFFRHRGRR